MKQELIGGLFKLCFPGNHTIVTVPESPMFNAPEAAVVNGGV